jgi:CRISPR-associated endonuclease/helicase Cas3
MPDLAPYFRYWGKTDRKDPTKFHLLPYHCLDVAAVGVHLFECLDLFRKRLASILNLTEASLNLLLRFFLALHDIGKFGDAFQGIHADLMRLLQETEAEHCYSQRHDNTGYLAWEALWDRFVQEESFGFKGHGMGAWKYQPYFQQWAKCITGHHGKPPAVHDGRSRFNATDHFSKTDLEAAFQFARDLWQFFQSQCANTQVEPVDEETIAKASWWIAGFTILCDWLGSDEELFPLVKTPMSLAAYWEAHALPKAEKALQKSGLIPPAINTPLTLKALTHETFQPTPLQDLCASHKLFETPQLWILEDITGSGKTEAAMLLTNRLMAAGLADGFFIGLPTMATADMMYARMATCYRQLFEADQHPSLILAHGSRHLSKDFRQSLMAVKAGQEAYGRDGPTGNAECSFWLADNRKKALLADAGVGTIDQTLLAILPTRHQSLRLMGLASKLLVVDEVHAYDEYMNELLKTLLTFHAGFGGSAVLLSATLPKNTRESLVNAFRDGLEGGRAILPAENEYPLVTIASTGETERIPIAASPRSIRSVPVKLVSDPRRPVDILKRIHWTGQCACWIRNTVSDAREAYLQLVEAEEIDPEKVILFHARYTLADRLSIEKRVTQCFGKRSTAEQRTGKILIATQVVEQSLDLDFDLLITDLAPMDLIIQRVGRLHRHKRDILGNPLNTPDAVEQRPAPVLHILSPEPCEDPQEDWYAAVFPKTAAVYPHVGRLWLTAHLLQEEGCIEMPHRLRHLVEGVYGRDYECLPVGLQEASRKAEGEARGKAGLGLYNQLDFEDGYHAGNGEWSEEINVPTRLGEESQIVHLARIEESRLVPIAEGNYPWDLSSVRIAKRRLARLSQSLLSEFNDALDNLVQDEKRLSKYTLILPMRPGQSGDWVSEGEDALGNDVDVLYSKGMGLLIGDETGGGL